MDDLRKSGETKRKDLEKQLQALTDNLRARVGLDPEAEPTPPAKTKARKSAASAAKKTADEASATTVKPKRAAVAKKPATENNN
ncbi:MAG: hypothetical protein ACRYG7_14400 [Janthinobacterium lividum]